MSGTTNMGTALKGAVMQIVPDSGWLGFESSHRAVSSNALMLSRLSSELRKTYHDLLDEPLPEHLVVFVRELESQGRFEGLAWWFGPCRCSSHTRSRIRLT